MSMLSRHYRIHEFARLAGVTVKALHHYDRLGLLQPGRTEAGYRVYCERDLETLEQIVALRFLGIPLKQIRSGPETWRLKLAGRLAAAAHGTRGKTRAAGTRHQGDSSGRGLPRVRPAERTRVHPQENHRGARYAKRHARRRCRDEEVLQRRGLGAAQALATKRGPRPSGGSYIAMRRRWLARIRVVNPRRGWSSAGSNCRGALTPEIQKYRRIHPSRGWIANIGRR